MPQGEKRTNGWIKGTQVKGQQPKTLRTPKRALIRQHTWEVLRHRLQFFIASQGYKSASRIAAYLGVRHSQVHRWTCPKCEHDAEPSYSIGKALEWYLTERYY